MTIDATYGSWTVSWPWPRVIFTDNYILGLALEGTDLYLFELTYDTKWTATAVCNLGAKEYVDQVEIIDFGPYYLVATYGKESDGTIHISNYERSYNASAAMGIVTAISSINPNFISGCNLNGQLIVCGTYSASAPWSSMNYIGVAWAGIGKLDFDPENDVTAGFRAMPWKGNSYFGGGLALKAKKLGNSAIIYGDGGVAMLTPTLVGSTHTMAVKVLSIDGVLSGNYIAGDDYIHGFIDVNRDFWVIQEGAAPERLGYKEYISDIIDNIVSTIGVLGTEEGLIIVTEDGSQIGVSNVSTTSNEVLVTYMPIDQTFYISNGVSCLAINKYGAYTTHQCPTSVGIRRGSLLGFFEDSDDREARVVTHSLDFRLRGIKTIGLVESDIYHSEGALGTDKAYATVDYRYNKVGDYTRRPWRVINPSGTATVMTAGEEFRVGVKADDYEDVRLSYINLKVKITDRRFMRGPAASSVDQITE